LHHDQKDQRDKQPGFLAIQREAASPSPPDRHNQALVQQVKAAHQL